ncbi:efflux RND transporter periplasmic adaptor subunit [Pseudoalteromonas citrea]|uniref:Efflux RND transporter periplasmic adaptor subunit n=1 Tax=Pseudoalteromonas citrea TaxID=43655 RepID=A0A5S3XNA4_9GAMM|nr:efflux RND transporter periplasmic adaptor subunit [Pseudoalteromonas citrea]TMP40997.1 efflux RND transporter periplasmic adaptor subunit [Pseudoalteromonas citrea]TMP58127.1 efflux RND transporter periplasmic adaptor subunit [Pseudoalteromonas citrea]
MNMKFTKVAVLPTSILLFLIVSFVLMSSLSNADEKPTLHVKNSHISTTTIEKVDHTVMFKAYGEIQPGEVTQLSTRVSGNVEYWSPKLVTGGVLNEGEVLYQLEDSQYQADYKSAEADLLNAKAALEEELGKGKVAEIELERINSDEQNSLFLRKPQIKSAYAAVRSAEAKMISVQKNLEYTVGRAPFDALVIDKKIGRGQFVAQGANIATLYNVDSAEIDIPIARFDRQFLRDNVQGVQAHVSLLDSPLVGVAALSRKVNLVDSTTRSYRVVAKVEGMLEKGSSNAFLQFGDFVQVEFAGKTLAGVYKIPEEFIDKGSLWVVNNGHLQLRKVNVLRNENGFAIVTSGIEASDAMVNTLPDYPYVGMPVDVVLSDSLAVR